MSKELKEIELFAGAGGLALGLEIAGFKNIACIEIDKNASETLRLNRPNWNIINKDISEVSSQNLEKLFNIKKGELDLLSGGAPCQPFSYAGKKLGLEDTRGTLFYHYATFLKKLQPKMFIFENVKGLLTNNNGKSFETIKSIFEEENYNIQYKVLNANDYNVPQNRYRLIVIGIRKDLDISFTFPKEYEYKPVLKDVLEDCPKSEGSTYSEKKLKYFKYIPEGGNWTNLPKELIDEYVPKNLRGGSRGCLRRLDRNAPSLTILTSPQQKLTERCHYAELRPLTIRESARIQSFPDNYKFVGSVSSQYKQIGNAVPVKLAEAVGKELYKSLTEE
mgnify:CR=1 FL=1